MSDPVDEETINGMIAEVTSMVMITSGGGSKASSSLRPEHS